MFDNLKNAGSKKMLKSKTEELKDKAIEDDNQKAIDKADDVLKSIENDNVMASISNFQDLLEILEDSS